MRLIRATAALGRSVTALSDALARLCNTPELRFPVEEARKAAVIEEIRSRLLATGAQLDETDGVRCTTAGGWWLLRASQTQAELVARAEAHDQKGLARIRAELEAQLLLSNVIALSDQKID